MRRIWLTTLTLLLAGCGVQSFVPEARTVSNEPPGGLAQPRPAPDFDNAIWINSAPLRLADLVQQRRVTLVEFWTFGCYNCKNVLPALRRWHTAYSDRGLTIVGVHYPEFDYERKVENVRAAVQDLQIAYPVAIDNEGKTWRAYRQSYWPTLYLVDKRGNLRYMRIGEGAYEQTEQWIQYLLNES